MAYIIKNKYCMTLFSMELLRNCLYDHDERCPRESRIEVNTLMLNEL